MKKIIDFTLLLALLFVMGIDGIAAPPAGNWQLTFDDSFDTAGLNINNWSIREGSRRAAFWGAEGVSVPGDGSIQILTTLVNGKIVSGSIDTRSKFEQRFGYFEARCRLPEVPGHWSSFWLLSREFGSTDESQLSGAEIDVFEYHTLLNSRVHHAVHWPKYGLNLQSRKSTSPVKSIQSFHVYGLLWEKDRYVFFVDDYQVWELREGISDVAQYLLLSNEVGPWAGNIDKTKLPDAMVCDYVRAYQQIK